MTLESNKHEITNAVELAKNAIGQANLRCPIKTIKGAAINGIIICRIGK